MSINATSSYYEYAFGHTTAPVGINIPNCVNLVGSHAGTHYADGDYQSMTAGSTAGNGCTLVGFNATPGTTSNNVYFDQDFDITVILRTVDVTNVRIWIAFVDQNLRMGNNNTFSGTANVIAFRFSTPASDGFWTGFCQDGSSGGSNFSTTAVSGSIAANTQYSLRIRKVSGTVYFSVDGGTEASTSSHVPSGNVAAGMSLEIWTTSTGATHRMDIGRVACTIGS